MKFLKIISLFSILCMILPIYSIDLLSSSDFLPHDTDKYLYSIKTIEKPITNQDALLDQPIQIYKRTQHNTYNSGITHFRITLSTKDNKIIITTSIWTTKNPSYLTWRNVHHILIANYLLNNTTKKILFNSGNNLSLPFWETLMVGTYVTMNALDYYLTKNIQTISQSIADTINIEKTTLGNIAEQKNMISGDNLKEIILYNKQTWENIPVIKITAKLSKNALESRVILYIKDQNGHTLQTSHDAMLGASQ